MIPVFITTYKQRYWMLRPQAHLINVYWGESQQFTIIGYEQPQFELPNNFSFYSVAPESCPVEQWSNGLIQFLHTRDEPFFVLLLDDYWPIRLVNNVGIELLAGYMAIHDDVLKMDLTDDRIAFGVHFDVEAWGHYDIIETPFETAYQTSIQAAIWNKELMLRHLLPGLNPWAVETRMQPPPEARVLGTRQCLIKYANITLWGEIIQTELDRIPLEHREAIMEWLPH